MKTLLLSTTALVAIAASFAAVGSRPKPAAWTAAHYENVLGTSLEIKLIAAEPDADRADAAALAEIDRLNRILSGYSPTSEFSRWAATRNQPIHISPELMQVLKLWDSWRTRTHGALNPAAEAVGRVWKTAEQAGHLPSASEMAAAARAAAAPQWSLNEAAGTATRLGNAPLMLNSFTKSYIVERAAEAALRTRGVTAAVVNIGGDLVVRGAANDLVNVADPRSDAENADPLAVLDIAGRAVATSGDYRRGFDIAGRHYSHIVDPRTGRTADGIAGATVVAPHAVDAGALATAFCVLRPEESRTLAATIPGVEYLLVTTDGARFTSPGWNSLQLVAAAQPQRKSLNAAFQARSIGPAATAWDSNYELTVNVELPQRQGNARRPYLAVWIEDKDHFPVRTLAVWFDKMRYLNEMKDWYRDDRLRAMAEGSEILKSVTSATRSAGKYSFKWDGKDNAGKLVKEGVYTVLVEAAREHGGHTTDRREINCNAAPSQAQAPAEGELGAVSFDYHKLGR